MNDHRMVGRAAFHCVKTRHRFRVGRIGAQPVDRLGGKRHESAGAEDLRGLADLGFHGLGSSAFLTASVCFFLNSCSLEAREESESARTATAKRAALAAPASPIAKV